MSRFLNNNSNSFNVSNHYTVTDERAGILAWLSPLEPRLRHQDVRDRREENIGDWLIESKEFRSWCGGSGGNESDSAAMFCYGDPGAGKTYISSLVIDTICDQAEGQGISVACFYFDFAARSEQSASNMLGALLKQVISGLNQIPDEIAKAFEKQKTVIGGRGLRLPQIVTMLEDISSSQRMFICLDALDECEAGHRVKILNALNEILNKSPGTRVFITGRPHVRAEVEQRLGGRATFMSISPHRGDIIRFIRSRLDEDTNPDAMDDALAADIMEKIPEMVSEIFLLVSLNIEAILREPTIHRRRQRLNAMNDGVGLGEAYGTTLERITKQGGEKARLGMTALMWILHSQRPLHVDELCQALAVEIRATHLNPDNVPSISTLLSCCQGFLTVEKETSTVRLIHLTLQEYLSGRLDLFGAAHSAMAETCLTYLNSQQVMEMSSSTIDDLRPVPFLTYSSIYWGVHAKMGFSICTKSLALELFSHYENHVSAKFFSEHATKRFNLPFLEDFSQFIEIPVHCASFFGIVELVATLIKMEGFDINGRDSLGFTPLLYGAMTGNEEVVKLLLAQENISPNHSDNYDQTPLSWAAENGHEGVVKLLLAQEEVNPNHSSIFGETPLSWAAKEGHEGVVKLLLAQEEVNPNYFDRDDGTPLSLAAEGGHEGIVKLLLAREEVNPGRSDSYGQTPLLGAAMGGHEGVVELLLAREGVNPMPLLCAAWSGHEGVVKLFLAQEGVNPNHPDGCGRTPLSWAAGNRHERIVELLLAREDIDPDH